MARGPLAAILSAPEIQKDVETFNGLWGEMDRVLWCLARYARSDLLLGKDTPVVVALIRTIKEWWGIQYSRADIDTVGASALVRQSWTEAHFADRFDPAGERFAVEQVEQFADNLLEGGAGRYELSLASKTLHWLMPWRIPVYDSYVRTALGIVDTRPADSAYREIVRHEFRNTRKLSDEDPRWMGEVEPKSPIRALDKCLWWRGGGFKRTARIEPDPWKVVCALGLKPC